MPKAGHTLCGAYTQWTLPMGAVDSCHPISLQIGAVDVLPNGPADRCGRSFYTIGWQIGAVDSAISNGPAGRCHGSCFSIGWQMVPLILLHNGLANRCYDSYYEISWRIGALDPTSQL
jgi:hypothetical protein